MIDIVRKAPLPVKLCFAFGWGAALVINPVLFVAVALYAIVALAVVTFTLSWYDVDTSQVWESYDPDADPYSREDM